MSPLCPPHSCSAGRAVRCAPSSTFQCLLVGWAPTTAPVRNGGTVQPPASLPLCCAHAALSQVPNEGLCRRRHCRSPSPVLQEAPPAGNVPGGRMWSWQDTALLRGPPPCPPPPSEHGLLTGGAVCMEPCAALSSSAACNVCYCWGCAPSPLLYQQKMNGAGLGSRQRVIHCSMPWRAAITD